MCSESIQICLQIPVTQNVLWIVVNCNVRVICGTDSPLSDAGHNTRIGCSGRGVTMISHILFYLQQYEKNTYFSFRLSVLYNSWFNNYPYVTILTWTIAFKYSSLLMGLFGMSVISLKFSYVAFARFRRNCFSFSWSSYSCTLKEIILLLDSSFFVK